MHVFRGLLIIFLSLNGLAWTALANAASNLTVVTDTQPPEFQNCLRNGTTNGSGAGDPIAGGYAFTSFGGITQDALDPGDNLVLDVHCDIETTVPHSSTYPNQTSVVWADSLGGSTLPAVAKMIAATIPYLFAVGVTERRRTGPGE